MRRLTIFILAGWLTLPAQQPACPSTHSADIIVYGGTAAGATAAITAARLGRSVILVAPEKHIGGHAVEGLGSSDIDNHWFRNSAAVGGIAREFYERIGKAYGQPGPVYKFESHVAERVFEEMLKTPGLTVHRELALAVAEARPVLFAGGTKRISAIRIRGTCYSGQVFIDATIEGDLLAAAGITTTIGREANRTYGEIRNGIRGENPYRNFPMRLDPYVVPGDPSSGLLPTIQPGSLGTPGDADSRIQGFCFRLCLTRDPNNRIAITQPAAYRPADYELYRRYAAAGGTLFSPTANLPNGKTDLGSWHDLSANLYGMNHDWPAGSPTQRQAIYRHHRDFVHGLLWFMATDPALPESTRAKWRGWGLCADEFTGNGGWPRSLYVRDGRRMVSDFVMTELHLKRVNPEPVADPVAVAYWPPDVHHVRRIVHDGAVYNEGFVFGGKDWGPFGISYRSLVPKRAEAANLITPTALSSSHVAYGAIRLEWTFMALGQAAANAASLAIEKRTAVQDVDYRALRDRLLTQGQIVDLRVVEALPGRAAPVQEN